MDEQKVAAERWVLVESTSYILSPVLKPSDIGDAYGVHMGACVPPERDGASPVKRCCRHGVGTCR